MDKFIDYIKKIGAIFAAIAMIVGFVAAFGEIDKKHLWWIAIMTVVLSSVAALGWMLIANSGVIYNHIQKERITNRMGYQKSKDKTFRDSIHKFSLIHRRDYLIISTGNYFSIRHIKGKNVSRNPSDGIVYYEGMDIKDTFKNVVIKAIDVRSGKELRVVNCSGNDYPKFFLAFKIIFEIPIMPQQEFDIQYSIFIKGEITALGASNEFMSISLKRCLKGVDELQFDVAFDIKPEHKCCFRENVFGEAISLKGVTVTDAGEINQHNDEFKELSRVWFQRGFIKERPRRGRQIVAEREITLNVYSLKYKKPKRTVYAIHFMNNIEVG